MKNTHIIIASVIIIGVMFLISSELGSRSYIIKSSGGSYCSVDTISLKFYVREKDRPTIDLAQKTKVAIIDQKRIVPASMKPAYPPNRDVSLLFCTGSSDYYSTYLKTKTECVIPNYINSQCAKPDKNLNNFYFTNVDGSVNSVDNVQAVKPSGTYKTTLTYGAGKGTYFGNPSVMCNNIAIFEYDKSQIKGISGPGRIATPGAFIQSPGYNGFNSFAIEKSGNGRRVKPGPYIISTQSTLTKDPSVKVTLYDCNMALDMYNLKNTWKTVTGVENSDLDFISLAPQSNLIYFKRVV